MLNITTQRVGGIRFIRIGRLSISMNVQSPNRYSEWLETKAEQTALRALMEEFA
jgi:hypothetical protein